MITVPRAERAHQETLTDKTARVRNKTTLDKSDKSAKSYAYFIFRQINSCHFSEP